MIRFLSLFGCYNIKLNYQYKRWICITFEIKNIINSGDDLQKTVSARHNMLWVIIPVKTFISILLLMGRNSHTTTADEGHQVNFILSLTF